jgi:FtsP/CotA-like multicopper oxidase with cupredoxin domain
MWLKISIIHFLLVLALLPVAQAISPTVGSVGAGHKHHQSNILDSSQLNLNHQKVSFTGRDRVATTINSNVPAPVLRWKQSESLPLDVANNMARGIPIHWHGQNLCNYNCLFRMHVLPREPFPRQVD